MSKNAIIFHGTNCSPDNEYYWYEWLRKELTAGGYEVSVPHYPEINHESINTFLAKVLANHEFDNDTVLVGHSSGAPLILSVLEALDVRVKLSVLVAGFSTQIGEEDSPILQSSYDWARIKQQSADFVFVNSVNDPWGCDDKQGRILFDNIGGTQIIKNDGHFGSQSQNLPYTRFPLVRDIILEAR